MPPVKFYFRVDFQRENIHFQGSFMEISGLGFQMTIKEKEEANFSRTRIISNITTGNVTLKRPLYPLTDKFSQWVNACFSLPDNKKGNIETYNLVIKLMDAQGKPLEGWLCSYAYPVKWTFGDLNAETSGLAFETIEMVYNRLERLNIKH